MVIGAHRRADEIVASVRMRHREAYLPDALTRREHDEAPRFGLVCCDTGDVLLTAACDLPPRRLDLADYGYLVRSTGGGVLPSDHPVPAVKLLSTRRVIDLLDGEHLLAGTLLRVQAELRRHTVVGLTLAAGDPGAVTLRSDGPLVPEELGAVAMRSRILAAGWRPSELPQLTLCARGGRLEPAPLSLQDAPRPVSPASPHPRSPSPTTPRPRTGAFFEAQHIDRLETTLPWAGRAGEPTTIVVVFVGPDERARDLAQELVVAARADDPELEAHLALTHQDASAHVGADSPYDTVIPLGGAAPDAAASLKQRLIDNADAVLHAGTMDGFSVLAGFEPRRPARHVALVTSTADDGPDGADVTAARLFEPLIDTYVATSEAAAHHLLTLEVVPDKVVTVPLEAPAASLVAGVSDAGAGPREAMRASVLELRLADAEQRLAAVVNSRSWRLTEPFRTLGRRLRR